MKRITRTLAVVLLLAYRPILAEDQAVIPDPTLELERQKELLQPEKERKELSDYHDSHQSAYWKLNAEQWKIKLSLGSTPFLRNREMVLEIKLTNISNAKESLVDDEDFDYEIIVANIAGKRVKLTTKGDEFLNPMTAKIGHYHWIDVPPSQSDTRKVDLAKLFDLSVPGTYTVTVGRYETVSHYPPSNVTSTSFIVQ